MASAVLANHQNEPDWTQHRNGGGPNFKAKAPFSESNPNPNYKLAKPKKKKLHRVAADDMEDSPVLTQSAASDDASSIIRKPNNGFSCSTYVSFNVTSKKDAVELKNRLISELEQIRHVKNQFDLHDPLVRSGSSSLPVKKGGGASKKVLGNKRPFPSNFGKESKRPSSINGNLMKTCGSILTKLMKHQFGYIFNSPVDAVSQGLHDYHHIIKNPMDLGTIKSKLAKHLYDTPFDFASDVRLTFNNATRYNPRGHEVFNLAEKLLARFEDLFKPVSDKLRDEDEEESQACSWNHHPQPDHRNRIENYSRENSTHIEMKHVQETRSNSNSNPNSNPIPDPPLAAQHQEIPRRAASPVQIRAKPVKLPKPKAKDVNKRDMTLEEKQKLGMALQNLPSEKMENVVQIVRKRNTNLTQDGDEIELDIETLDVETCWDLDRFISYYKKMVSKLRRQALMGIQNETVSVGGGNGLIERIEVGNDGKKGKKGECGDEDVDIGDEMPVSNFPPVEIEKDNGHASSSSNSSGSSGTDSSSSSDSGSSSGSDSDADDLKT